MNFFRAAKRVWSSTASASNVRHFVSNSAKRRGATIALIAATPFVVASSSFQRTDSNVSNVVGGSSVGTASHLAAPEFEAHWASVVGKHRDDLPTFTANELAAHGGNAERVWVSYKSGVYDITEWIDAHPGGRTKILLAAGKSIEPFWHMYAQHNAGWVFEILEEYRIGNIKHDPSAHVVVDPYDDEPPRDPRLIVHSLKPFNAEPPSDVLVDSGFLTPNELFYVRNHLPVPRVDPAAYRVTVDVPGFAPREFSLDELKRDFPQHSVVSAVQCGGNRRTEFAAVKPVKGGPWLVGAISNARWSGVLLRDLLKRTTGTAALDETLERAHGRHVHFEGLDIDESGHPYSVSVPTTIALASTQNTLLAYEMNGEPLPRDHGFPVRAVVPGVTGARQVKWLGAVRLRDVESDSQHQQRDYKSFSPSSDWDNLDWSVAPSLQAMPVQSAVCWPKPGSTVTPTQRDNALVLERVRGYAYSGGGAAVVRVDVTADGGKTWHTAQLDDIDSRPGERQTFSWRRWSVDLPVPTGEQAVKIQAKAVDENYNTQPESTAAIWNMRGLLNNAWNESKVTISK